MRKLLCLCVMSGVLGVAGFAASAFAATASWNATDGATGYILYRAPGPCASPGVFAKVNTYGKVTSGAIANPTVNGAYCHRITATNAAGESVPSNTVEYTYAVVPPTAPQGFTVKP